MSRTYESIAVDHGQGEGRGGDAAPLPFETEFDGARRPQAAGRPDPCDPSRYWDFFSGTD